MNEEERARRHVRRLRDFYIHVAIYVIVIGGFALLNWIVSPTFWWVVFPAIGWGIGLAAHGTSVLFEDSLFGVSWEERKTRELLQRDQRRG
jgi:two-component system, LytTR family, sensor kinase